MHTTFLSTSDRQWRVIHQGQPLCGDTTLRLALGVAKFYRVQVADAAWDGDRARWIAVNTLAELEEIARGAIERHLGDSDCESADAVYDAAFRIAHDALFDAGLPAPAASLIARDMAQRIAQP